MEENKQKNSSTEMKIETVISPEKIESNIYDFVKISIDVDVFF